MLILQLCACGLVVPDVDVAGESPAETPLRVNDVTNKLQCELAKAVIYELAKYKGLHTIDWLSNWAARVTFKLITNEKSALTPGLSLTRLLPNSVAFFPRASSVSMGQSFSLGFGGELSSSATRTETIGYFFVLDELIARDWPADCQEASGVPVDGNFKLREWLDNALLISSTPRTISRPFKTGGPIDVLSDEIQFLITTNLTATPSWKLIDITSNASNSLLSSSRVKTNYVLVTLGPLSELKSGRPRLSDAAENVHNTMLSGQATGTNLINQVR